jgi:hypothetical protein
MADEWKAPFAVLPVRPLILLFPLLALVLVPGIAAQNAAARKDFVTRLGQSTILTRKGDSLVPKYRLSADGPDSSFFVYHASLMNPSICRSMLTEGFVSKFRALGFTKLVCTDDADGTFSFDPIVQTVSPVTARRDYVEMIRRSVIRQLAAHTPAGYNLSASGHDATSFVHHQSVVSLDDCNRLLVDRFVSGLRGRGFFRLVCTDDRSVMFTYDLSSQSPATAFALLESENPVSLETNKP